MRIFYFLTFLLCISIGYGIYLQKTYTSPNTNVALTTSPVKSTPKVKYIPNPKPIPTPTPTPTPTPIPKPVPTPTPTPAKTCGNGGACTATEVASHNSQTDCWVYLSPINKVYNITNYVSNSYKHPGGDVIVPYCRTNIYDYFIGSGGGHSHSNRALNMLQAYYIGPFK